MVHTYLKKPCGRESKPVSAEYMRSAVTKVIKEGMTVRRVATDLAVSRTTLT